MGWRDDLVPAALLAGAFLLLLLVAEAWARLGRPPAEWPRKLVHLGGGAICLAFPFVLNSTWTVAALAVGLLNLFLAGKRWGFLRSLHGVERRSRGAEYYPLMVVVLFWMAHDRPWLYAAALLTLAVADALAALVGGQFGRLHYQIDDEYKSVEGSLTFFVAAFAAIFWPLVASSDPELPGASHRVAVACVAAALVTVFEAVARHGRDNLWVPLGTLLVVLRLIKEPIEEAIWQMVSFTVVCMGLAVARAVTGLVNVGAALMLILVIYGSWALASFDWALPLVAGVLLSMAVGQCFRPPWLLRSAGVTHMALPAVVLVFGAELARLGDRTWLYDGLYGPFLAACAVPVAQNVWDCVMRRRRNARSSWAGWAIGVSAVVASCLVGPLWLRGLGSVAWLLTLFSIALATVGTHDKVFLGRPPSTQRQPFVSRRYATIVLGMAVAALLQFAGWAPTLSPR